MTEQPHPGLKAPLEERLRAAQEALSAKREDREPEPFDEADEPVPGADVIERPEAIGSFDAEALADLAADTARRTVRPEDRPGDLLVQALSGGAAGEEAMYQLRQKYRRAGWHYSIAQDGTRTPHRR